MKFRTVRLYYRLVLLIGTAAVASLMTLLAHFLPGQKLYLFWLIVGGPTVIYGAVLLARNSIREIDPENWGHPVARTFGMSMVLYAVIASAIPFLQTHLPSTFTALYRREKQTDTDLSERIDARAMYEGQQVLLKYGADVRDAETEQIKSCFDQLIAKRRKGTFEVSDEAREKDCVARYERLRSKLDQLREVANNPSQTPNAQPGLPSASSEAKQITPPTISGAAGERTSVAPHLNPYSGLVHYSSTSAHQIAIALQGTPPDDSWLDDLKAHLRKADPRIQPDAFDMSKWGSEGISSKVEQGDVSPLVESGALVHFHYVALIRAKKTCRSINPSGVSMVSCTISLRCRVFDQTAEAIEDLSISSDAPGFSEDEALDLVTKKVALQAKATVFDNINN
jgi:hypothetical protein